MSELDISLAEELAWSEEQRRSHPLFAIEEALAASRAAAVTGPLGAPPECYPTDTATFAMHLRGLVRLLVTHLQAAGIDEPLGERFTLATIVQDLCDLVGEPAPPAVARYVG